MKKPLVLIGLIIITQFAGIIGTLTIDSQMKWYNTIEKPFFTPPNWIFGPVWIVLYFLIALSIYYVYVKDKINIEKKKIMYLLFILQLILNAIWTPLFFGINEVLYALLDIVALLIVIFGLSFMFYKDSKVSFWLFIPYVLWTIFAFFLNISIYILNYL